MAILGCLTGLVLVVYPSPDKNAFMVILIGYGISNSYIDALAEGITSIVTKLNERIAILEAGGKGKAHDESMKAIGLFSSFRGVFKSLMVFLGGYVAQRTRTSHLMVSGIILAAYPVIFCIQLFFIFKEKKVTKKSQKTSKSHN